MDLGLNEVQQMLKSSAREFLAQECPRSLVRQMETDPRGYPDQLWQHLAGLGWTGLAFPEEYGGSGGSFLDLAVLLEEMGHALLPGPFFSTVALGGLTVLDTGSEAQKRDILPRIASGQLTMTLALTEPSATWKPWGVEATASRQDDNYILNGTKLFVPDAHTADLIIVAARTEASGDPSQGVTLFLVPAGSPGLNVRQLNAIAQERYGEVVLEQVSVPSASVLGLAGRGWQVVEHIMQRAVAGRCMEMVGCAAAVLEMTVDYARQRTQFGRPIGSFQAIQHFCANMATEVEGCRLMANQAAWSISEGLPAEMEVSMAKAWCSAAFDRICTLAHQSHGAIGFTREHDLQLYTRRAKVQELMYGDVSLHRELALQQLEKRSW